MLIKMQISDYPQMKQQSRQKLHRNISRMAYPSNFEDKIVSSEDMARLLGKEIR
jgi:nitric oxide reductase activation protein